MGEPEQIKVSRSILSLSQLPDQWILYIMGFMNQTDIFWFKLTSRRIAILCLEEMRKITIGIFCPQTFSMKYCRYHENTKLISLMEQWSNEYHIDRNDILLFQNTWSHGASTFNTIGT